MSRFLTRPAGAFRKQQRLFRQEIEMPLCGVDRIGALGEVSPGVFAVEAKARQCRHVLPVELIDPRFYHLDTCFCPLAPDEAIWFPPAFDAYGQRVIQSHIPRLFAVQESEAVRFACNAVVVGKNVVTNTGCDQLGAGLRAWDMSRAR